MVAQPPLPTAPPTTTLTQDDRALAGLAHASLFIGFPLIAPIAIYAIKKDSSRFVAFHALQAAIAHVALVPLVIFGYVVSFALSFGSAFAFGPNSVLGPIALVFVWIIALVTPVLVVSIISIYAAYRAFMGHGYRIPIASRIALSILDAPSAPPPPPI